MVADTAGDADHYREVIDDERVMVLPVSPFVFSGKQAISSVADTPRWSEVTLSEKTVVRPQEGLLLIAYKAVALRDGSATYGAFCTTTTRRLEHDVWRVIQHQQTLTPIASSTA